MKFLTFANEVSMDFHNYIKVNIQNYILLEKFNGVFPDLLFQNFYFSSFKVIS